MPDAHDVSETQSIINRLKMQPHPEGGWYVETWRDSPADGSRGAVSCIYYLLAEGQRSAWHRIDATEIWHFQAGEALELIMAPEGRAGPVVRLGPDIGGDDHGHAVVPAGCWQSARPLGRWTLVSCTVAPAFTFEGFEMAPTGWEPAPLP